MLHASANASSAVRGDVAKRPPNFDFRVDRTKLRRCHHGFQGGSQSARAQSRLHIFPARVVVLPAWL